MRLRPNAMAAFGKGLVTLVVLFNLLFLAFTIVGGLLVSPPEPITVHPILLVATWVLWFAWHVGVGWFMWAALPSIRYDDSGLWIRFLRRPVHIPWTRVVGIKRRGLFDLIVCERLSPIHRLFGVMLFGFTIKPCLPVWLDRRSRDRLARVIRE